MSKPVFLNLKKLSDVVNKKFVKKDVYDKLVKKVGFIDTNKLVKKQIVIRKSVILNVKSLVLLA